VFNKVLIANRGEIAVRIAGSAHGLGIKTALVVANDDIRAYPSSFVGESIVLEGDDLASTYLNIDAILRVAKEVGADCIHPGYGFLSENAKFAQAVVDAGLTFIGPSPEVIEQMGSKVEAKRLMESVGVPVLAGAPIDTVDELLEVAKRVGWPLLIKASAGGGGRGMRVVRADSEAAEHFEAARREALNSFGDGTLLAEKYLEHPRHIEVQIFGDQHGNIVDLFERDCSVQRRHQKLIEESPAPNLDESVRTALRAAARLAAETVSYVGAGTVEFIVDQDGTFAFLEMNTRLQVEHPVTELVTDLDLVEWQFRVAAGEVLEDELLNPTCTGYAIEARLCAEDPRNGFLPQAGQLDTDFQQFDIRIDAGMAGGLVSSRYDPLLAKFIAHGETREEAADELAWQLRIWDGSGVTTNRDLLVGVLEDPTFLAGGVSTSFLEENDPVMLCDRVTTSRHRLLAAAIASWLCAVGGRTSLNGLIPIGFRNVPDGGNVITVREGGAFTEATYVMVDNELHVTIADVTHRITALQPEDRDIDDRPIGLYPMFEVLGSTLPYRTVTTVEVPERKVFVSRTDDQCWVEFPERFSEATAAVASGSLVAAMPGLVSRVEVEVGSQVAEGDALVVMEAMKMEHVVRAPFAGVVEAIHVTQSTQVEAGQLLVEIGGEA
jgi:acetyl/propionyl-CoA carboxylase alpha subunit